MVLSAPSHALPVLSTAGEPILSKGKICQAEEGTQPREQADGGRELPHGQLSQGGGCAVGTNTGGKQMAWLRHHAGIQTSRI